MPPLPAATHTSAAVASAISLYGTPVRPAATKSRQVASSVATVMPEIGFEEEPISPVMRLDTVTKKKPNSTTSAAVGASMPSGGASAMATASASEPPSTSVMGRSRSVRSRAPPLASTAARPSRNARQIVGRERSSVSSPPVATAPAPT